MIGFLTPAADFFSFLVFPEFSAKPTINIFIWNHHYCTRNATSPTGQVRGSSKRLFAVHCSVAHW